jgi:hypothetical protein
MNTPIAAAAALAATVGFGAIASAQPMFALGDFASFGSQGLYRVDTATGAATLVGDTGVNGFIGLEWNGTSLVGVTTTNSIYSINTVTGQAFFVGGDTGVTPEGDLAFRDGALVASTTGGIVGVDAAGFTDIASLDTPLDLSGLTDLDGTDWLGFATGYGTSDAVYSVSSDGVATFLFDTATNSTGVGALVRDDAGTVYLSDGAVLYTVDLGAGVANAVGDFGVAGVSGLAVIPAPGAALAFVGATLVAARRRR